MWIKYNPNPAGRSVGDCSVRAIAKALNISWEEAFAKIVSNAYLMADMPSSNSVWGSVLFQNGFKRSAIENSCPDCYTAEDFIIDHPKGIYVLGFGNHVATVIDGFYMILGTAHRKYRNIIGLNRSLRGGDVMQETIDAFNRANSVPQ